MVREARILSNMKLVEQIAGKYVKDGGEKEELIAIGNVGLIKAADTFDTQKNVQFSTYAAVCIRHEIACFQRKQRQQKRLAAVLECLELQRQEKEEEKEEIEVLYHAFAELSRQEKELLILRYGIGDSSENYHSQRETAVFYQISQATLFRREKQILMKLRKLMES